MISKKLVQSVLISRDFVKPNKKGAFCGYFPAIYLQVAPQFYFPDFAPEYFHIGF